MINIVLGKVNLKMSECCRYKTWETFSVGPIHFIAFEITGPGKSGWRRTSQGKTSTLKVGVQATDVDLKI